MLYCKPLVDQTKSVQNTLIFNYERNRTKPCQSLRFPHAQITGLPDLSFTKFYIPRYLQIKNTQL